MSTKTMLIAAMMLVVSKLGGAHLTREARERTVYLFVDLMHAAGYTHLRKVSHIRGKYIRLYVAARLAARIRVRTLHNEIAHLRSVLRAGGCSSVADANELSNRALGLIGASRKGTKTALNREEYERVRRLTKTQDRPGMGAMLRLARSFGLRGAEAIHARSDTLERWAAEVVSGSITVYAGTKGGRMRVVPVLEQDEAAAAIQEARDVAASQGGFLVVRADGKPCSLKEARSIYHGWFHRAGIQPHSARYAYAQELKEMLTKRGYSEREAYLATGLALGHGDGRGRYIKQVYGPRMADIVSALKSK
jgi:hypothetical protein